MIISISAAAAATVRTLVLSRHHFNYAGKKGKIKTKKLTAQVANQMDCGKLVRREEEEEEEEEELSDNFIFGDKLIITSNWLIGSETQCTQTVYTAWAFLFAVRVSGQVSSFIGTSFSLVFSFTPRLVCLKVDTTEIDWRHEDEDDTKLRVRLCVAMWAKQTNGFVCPIGLNYRLTKTVGNSSSRKKVTKQKVLSNNRLTLVKRKKEKAIIQPFVEALFHFSVCKRLSNK